MRPRAIILILTLVCITNSFSFESNIAGSEVKLKLKDKCEVRLKDDNSKQNYLKKETSSVTSDKFSYFSDIESSVKGENSAYVFRNSKDDRKKYKVDPIKMTALGVVAAGVFTGMHIYYANTWWKDQVTYFKYAEDGYYARNMDKASHVFTANFFTVATATAYEWAGVEPGKALLYGAFTSMAYETYIEMNDGFAPNWGFDWGDMGANVAGALYPFLQKAYSPLENINFKWSFQPGWISKKTSSENKDDLLDDYTNMTFWLSVNPMMVLPKSFTDAKYYPNFLAFALGMSIQNASHTAGSQNAEVEWFLSFDWDITKLPGNSEFMKKLKKILNFYHFPAPAVRISPSGVWYGLYF
jgi:Predicted periplasmic lipoprotein (DUF2279)